MASRKVTTIRLDAEDIAALARARRDGVVSADLIRRGLRTVGARYYAEQAAPGSGSAGLGSAGLGSAGLGSAGLGSADPDTVQLQAWLGERRAFERLPARTKAKHDGRWVAVRGGRIIMASDDRDALSRKLRARGGAPFFLTRVGHDPELVDMPGFDVV